MNNYKTNSNYKGSGPRPQKEKFVPKFSNYEGKFVCYKCKSDVPKARYWKDTMDLTWMCECKYISKVNLNAKGY